jgi:hypothetical protein
MRPVRPRPASYPNLSHLQPLIAGGRLCSPTDANGWRKRRFAEGPRRPPAGRAAELRLPAARAAFAAGGRRRAAAEVLARAPAPRRLRGARPRVPATEATFYEFGRRLGPGDSGRLRVCSASAGRCSSTSRPARGSSSGERLARLVRAAPRRARGASPAVSCVRSGGRSRGWTDWRIVSASATSAPCDAAHRPPAESIEFVSSTDTCEHIPGADLAEIFRECFRLLRPGGAFSCRNRPAGPLTPTSTARSSRYHFPPLFRPRWRPRQLAAPPPEPPPFARSTCSWCARPASSSWSKRLGAERGGTRRAGRLPLARTLPRLHAGRARRDRALVRGRCALEPPRTWCRSLGHGRAFGMSRRCW